MDNRRIGVFDSGIGGLTVAQWIFKDLPKEKIIYYGDTARVPYGSKEVSTIKRYAAQIGDFLVQNNAKLVVIACNTVSATCKKDLQKRFPEIDIIDVITPMVDRVVSDYSDKKVGVIGTKVTVESNLYENLILEKNPSVSVVSKECTSLVSVIEDSMNDDEIVDQAIRDCVDDFVKENGIEVLVLGCTHFPLIFENFQRLYPNIVLLNPSKEVANAIDAKLREKNLFAEESDSNNQYFASDVSDNFIKMVDDIDSGALVQLKAVTSDQ